MVKENPLGTQPVAKLILRFSVPAIISMLVNAIYNIVDQIFIGQGIGMLGMAATNVAFPLTTISTAIALLIGVGGASNFSLLLGQGKREEAASIIGNALFYLTVSGVALALVCFAFLEPLLLAFGATEQVMPYAIPYTMVIVLGLPFAIFSTGACHIIRADGAPRFSMLCMLAGAVFNLIFDPIFIFVFDWGISGIAWATTLGQVLSAAIALLYLRKNLRSAPLTRKSFRPQGRCLRAIAALGMASCFNQLAITAMQITLNNTMRHYGAASIYGSEIPLAIAGVISKINMLSMGFCIGIAQGCQPIHGYNFGAGNYARVRETLKKAITAATIISVFFFALFQLFPRQLLSIFGDGSEEYFAFGTRYFRIFMFMTFANGIQPVTANFFTSIGKATRGLFMSLTRQVLLLIPLILLLPMLFGIDGIMYAAPVADAGAFILAALFIFREMRTMGKEDAAVINP